jgi:hypothetical protein
MVVSLFQPQCAQPPPKLVHNAQWDCPSPTLWGATPVPDTSPERTLDYPMKCLFSPKSIPSGRIWPFRSNFVRTFEVASKNFSNLSRPVPSPLVQFFLAPYRTGWAPWFHMFTPLGMFWSGVPSHHTSNTTSIKHILEMSFTTHWDLSGHLNMPHRLSMGLCPDIEQAILPSRPKFCPDCKQTYIGIIRGPLQHQHWCFEGCHGPLHKPRLQNMHSQDPMVSKTIQIYTPTLVGRSGRLGHEIQQHLRLKITP